MLDHITHVLLDGARMGAQMEQAIELGKHQMSLYAGQQAGALSALAPRLFSCTQKNPLGAWCLQNGWGNSWGIFLKSPLQLPELHAHFRKFLKVQTESGKSLFFRFYDPRVLRIFLPTCSAEQLQEFFDKAISYFLVEDEDPAFAIRFWLEGRNLKQERIAVAALIAALPPSATTKEKLPPETIEALRQMGMLEQVLALLGQEDEIQSPASETHTTAAVIEVPKPEIIPPVIEPRKESKPKSKWNMFD